MALAGTIEVFLSQAQGRFEARRREHRLHRPSTPLGLFPEQPKPRLYDCVVEGLLTRHYSRPTEQAYIHWIAVRAGAGGFVLGRPRPVLSRSAEL
jgi:hypothetical protein